MEHELQTVQAAAVDVMEVEHAVLKIQVRKLVLVLPFHDVGRDGAVRHLVPLKYLADLAVVEQGGAVRDLEHLLVVVADVEHGHPVVPDLAQHPLKFRQLVLA